MQKLKIYFLMLFLFSFLVNCTDTVAPVLTGTISGFIYLYEEDNTRINDRSGVKVSIEGRSNYTYTNKDGRYTLENVEAGIFNILFEKEGFGLHKIIAREFVGGGDAYLYDIMLMKLPSFNVTSLNINKVETQPPYLSMHGNLSDARNYYRYVILFFGKTESVSNDPENYLLTNSLYVYPDSSFFKDSFWNYKEYFIDSGFDLGETVYVAAYSISYPQSFYDPITGRYFYYNVGTSPAKSSFVLD